MKNSERLFKLFIHSQSAAYRSGYSMDFRPFITKEKKLKYQGLEDSKIKTATWFVKDIALTAETFLHHICADFYNYINIDENGIIKRKRPEDPGHNKPAHETEMFHGHELLKIMDIGLVIPPLGEDGKGIFGAIDVDTYDNPKELQRIVKEVYEKKIPLVPCYSKSKGLHLYLHTKVPFEYDAINKILIYYRHILKIKAKEIFPKQAKAKDKPGNAIAIPYRSSVLRYGVFNNEDVAKYKEDFRQVNNVMIKDDLTTASLNEYLDSAESKLVDLDILKSIPVLEIKEEKEKPKEKNIKNTVLDARPLSSNADKIIESIKNGAEHKEGGTFDNWIVDLVYCCAVIDKRSDGEIEEYFELVKHKSEKAKETDYLKTKINNCRTKYNKPDPGPELQHFFEDIVWDCEVDKYFILEKNKHVSNKSLNQLFSKHFNNKTTPEKEFYNYQEKKIVDACLYRPDLFKPEDRIINDGKLSYINKFIPNEIEAIKATEGDLKPFFDLMAYLFPNEKERNHVLDWLAHVIQKTGVKIRHAVMVYSEDWQIGKGTLFDTMVDILGEENAEPGNVKSILDKGVTFSEKLLVLIDECSSTGEYAEKRNLVNDLKTIVSEGRIQKRLLYKDYGITKTFTNFLIFTNKPDALTIDANDPRYFVVDHYEKRLPQEFYNNYHSWRKDKGSNYVYWYLKNRNINKFNPTAPPPLTQAKSRMADQTANPLLQHMSQAYQEGQMPFPFINKVIGTTEIAEWYKKHGSMKQKKFADNPKEVVRCFKKMGFHELGQVHHKNRDEKPSLWISRDIENLKHKKKSEVCNHVWKPLNLHESNSEIKEERATQNFQNYQSTLNDRGNKDSPDYWHERHD